MDLCFENVVHLKCAPCHWSIRTLERNENLTPMTSPLCRNRGLEICSDGGIAYKSLSSYESSIAARQNECSFHRHLLQKRWPRSAKRTNPPKNDLRTATKKQLMSLLSFLDRSHTIAKPGFSRWMVPPAALCIHLCIGQAYAFSVFNLPMVKLIGISRSAPNDWKLTQLGWIFSIAIFVLGISAAAFGRWVEEAGPRKAMFTAGICWASGFLVSAFGVHIHQLWVVYLGYGVFGGLGLGIGYISPVSTLIRWFPDRPGMATGMAIMGFGGAAFIASPLSVWLMARFSTPTHIGVAETFICLGLIYLLFMWVGAAMIRVPPLGWEPQGYTLPNLNRRLVSNNDVYVYEAIKTPQFWLVWWVLCLNVTAGIGIIGMASPMLQEVFGGRLIGVNAPFEQLNQVQHAAIATLAAGFTGLLSLFNIAGRFGWASFSDYIGRKPTYMVFFLLGIALYASIPWTAAIGSLALFVGFFCIILSMYGGGFATVPAYLADLFGTRVVGAIHGRLLTAWSAAGIFGPVIVNYLREYQLSLGVAHAQVYTITMYILAGLLVLGLICNSLVRPVDIKHFMTPAEEAALDARDAQAAAAAVPAGAVAAQADPPTPTWKVTAAWLAVGIPIAWGVWVTLKQAAKLFGGG